MVERKGDRTRIFLHRHYTLRQLRPKSGSTLTLRSPQKNRRRTDKTSGGKVCELLGPWCGVSGG